MTAHILHGVARLALAGVLLALIACGKTPSTATQSAMEVQAKGENAIAAGRDVIIDKNTVINEYDTEKARKIEAGRFASAMHRECTQYVETLRGLQLQREKGDRSDAMVPSIFSPIYASPDTRQLFGEQIYKELNAQQEQLSALRGKIFTMRQQQAMSAAYTLMAQQGGRRAQERLAGNPAPSADEFLSAKNELLNGTQAHCQYLQSLM